MHHDDDIERKYKKGKKTYLLIKVNLGKISQMEWKSIHSKGKGKIG